MSSQEPLPAVDEEATAVTTRRFRWRRPLLLAGPVLAAAIALWLYLSGGRYVTEQNAYIGTSIVTIAPEIGGRVTQKHVSQNQRVTAGQLLLVIDPEPYRIAVEAARAQLGLVKDQILAQIETWRARKQSTEEAEATQRYAQQQFRRTQTLARQGTSPTAQLDAARRDLRTAEAAFASARLQAQAALAELGGDGDMPIEQRPQYRSARAQLETAERNLALTRITAPVGGSVTNTDAVNVGTFLAAGQATMSIVAIDVPWADANLRESDLTHVRIGNPTTLEVDAFPGITFTGSVETINPASGAAFALIPPQNATGNWVKVVQRFPVRIALQPRPGAPALRNGMSATVSIDTGRQRSLTTLWHDISTFWQ